jgi:hypothetical protein
VSTRLKYATVGVLFVNISIGGTLTPFAAPPVLMVAATWNWDMPFMLSHFGWKAAVAVTCQRAAAMLLFRRELTHGTCAPRAGCRRSPAGPAVVGHRAPGFPGRGGGVRPPSGRVPGLFLFFLGIATAYERHQNPLILREALLVAFFLAGLVVLGGVQSWWLQPLLMGMDATAVFLARPRSPPSPTTPP